METVDYRMVSGAMIRKIRGPKSLRDVAKDAGGAFSPAALYKWEQGSAQPTVDKLPHLLAALGCSYEDISEAVDLAVIK